MTAFLKHNQESLNQTQNMTHQHSRMPGADTLACIPKALAYPRSSVLQDPILEADNSKRASTSTARTASMVRLSTTSNLLAAMPKRCAFNMHSCYRSPSAAPPDKTAHTSSHGQIIAPTRHHAATPLTWCRIPSSTVMRHSQTLVSKPSEHKVQLLVPQCILWLWCKTGHSLSQAPGCEIPASLMPSGMHAAAGTNPLIKTDTIQVYGVNAAGKHYQSCREDECSANRACRQKGGPLGGQQRHPPVQAAGDCKGPGTLPIASCHAP